MKKEGSMLAVILVAVAFAIPFVSARLDLREGGQQIVDWIVDLFSPFFEFILGASASSEFFFYKVLLLLLLFFVINAILGRIPLFADNKAIPLIVSIAVSVLSVRYMSDNELVMGVLLQYGVLGVTLTTVLPFLIIFYFVHVTKMGSIGRRLVWGITALVYISLWLTKYDQISDTSNYILLGIVVLIILSMIFDRRIRYYFMMHELNVFKKGAASKTIAALQAEYLNIINVDSTEAAARRQAIERRLRALGGMIP